MAGKALLRIAVLLCSSLWQLSSWATDPPDLTPTQHTDIERALHCAAAKAEESRLGCRLLAAFAQAKAPDQALFKQATPLRGRRWLGVTVVVGHEAKREWMREDETPRWNAFVFGVRYSGNFHTKVHYPNGVAPTYIWPTSESEAVLIRQAVNELLANKQVLQTHPLAAFARDTELGFSEVVPTQGSSWLVGGADTFVRQQGDDVYVVEIGGRDADHPKYWVSHISLRNQLRNE